MLTEIVRAVRDLCEGSPPLEPSSGIVIGVRDGRTDRVRFQRWDELAEWMPPEQLAKIRASVAEMPSGAVPFCLTPSPAAALIGWLSPRDHSKGSGDVA